MLDGVRISGLMQQFKDGKVKIEAIVLDSDRGEDMFLRRLMGILAKMAKADGSLMIFCPSVVDL